MGEMPEVEREVKGFEDQEKKLRDIKLQTILSKEKPKFKSLGMGINNDVFYFGTKIYDEEGKPFDAIVTSDHKIYINWKHDNEIKNKFGLNYRFEFFDSVLDRTWSNKSIKEWLYGKVRKVTLKEMYLRILKKNKFYMVYPDERWHKFVALDILSTYFTEVFEAKGRTLPKGEKGSGKTKQSQLYQLLAFNPMMSADWTKSSIFRAVESTKGTVIVDNFDEVPDEVKRDIMIVYRVYKKGVKSVRTEGDRIKRPVGFDLYTSVILNNILGLDDVSEDRSNIIPLLRSKDRKIINKHLKPDNPEWNEIRDDSFLCTLQNWKAIQETYEKLKENKLIGRELEIVEPILTLAKTIDKKLFKELLEFELEKIEQKKVKELGEDWLYNSLKSILEKLKNDGSLENWVFVKDVVDEVAPLLFDVDKQNYLRKKHSLSIYLGKIFKATPLFKGRQVQGHSQYLFKRDDVIKFCDLKDFDDLVKTYSTYSTLSTYSTNSTNPTNPTNQQVGCVGCVGSEGRNGTSDSGDEGADKDGDD